jgi:FkbM family methyltransferase
MIHRIFNYINQNKNWRIPVTIQGVKFHPNSGDRFVALLLHKLLPGSNSFARWISANAKPGNIVLDIGSNQGLFAIAASSAVGPSGMVHAFEPDENLAACIAETISKNKINNIKLHKFALGAKSELLKLYKNPYNAGDNRLTTSPSNSKQTLDAVNVERLDDVSEIQRFDFVKIDVQGWELAVLEGMRQKLQKNSKAKILFEFWPHGMKMAGFDPLKLIVYMLENGFTLREESSGFQLSTENASVFIKKIHGKKYTDIEAFKLA